MVYILFIISNFFKPLSLKYSIDFGDSWKEPLDYTCEPVQDYSYCKILLMDTYFAECSTDNQRFGNFSYFSRITDFSKVF